MDLPAVRLLLLTKEERSLKDHTTDFFLDLAFHTHYPDSALISYYWTRLNKEVKAKTPFPSDGPRGKFIYFFEPVLFSCGCLFTVVEADEEDATNPLHPQRTQSPASHQKVISCLIPPQTQSLSLLQCLLKSLYLCV